jgi:hypothetical protein
VVTSPKRKKRVEKKKVVSEELIGVALMDDALIEYLCDSGAVRTIISEAAFEKIRERSPGKVLEQYKGKALKSANKNLNILGQVRVNLCKMSDKIELKNMIAIVVEGLQGHECLLGRNWQHRIPQLRTTLSKTGTIV